MNMQHATAMNVLHFENQTVLRSAWVTLLGAQADIELMAPCCIFRLYVNHKPCFERPLDLIWTSPATRNAEVEERISRLERMMNVLVEQDTPAGEALRRLGGVKIDPATTMTTFAVPALVHERSDVEIRVEADRAFQIKDFVTIRVSLAGVEKRAVC